MKNLISTGIYIYDFLLLFYKQTNQIKSNKHVTTKKKRNTPLRSRCRSRRRSRYN